MTPERAAALAAGSDDPASAPIRRYRNGRDLADHARGALVIDLFGRDEGEVRRRHPAIYQHLLETVKPDRDRNPRQAYRDSWWVFGEPRRDMRAALEGLSRYIVTVETAKHRWFRFVEADILPDNKLIVVASDDPWVLGVLSSRAHRAWFVANAGRIGVYDGDAVYVKGPCFDRFPFPVATPQQEAEVAALAVELDELRQRVLARHPHLSMTGLYNARDRLTSGEPMTPAERETHEAGCITLLDHLHRRIDLAVAEAYGWPREIGDEAIVARLLALNAERAVEEGRGVIHWLRAAFQKSRVLAPVRPVQMEADLAAASQAPVLPDTAAGVANVVLGVLRTAGRPVKSRELAARFREPLGRRGEARLEQTLAVLAVAGSVQHTETGWFAPRGR